MSASNQLDDDCQSSGQLHGPSRQCLHDPVGSLAKRLSHFADEHAQQVGRLIEITSFHNVVAQNVSRHAPFLPMSQVGVDGSLVGYIEFVGLVDHSGLSDPGAAFVNII